MDELKEYGLSEKEIKIYLANLKLGECTANELAKETGIRRSTTYEVIESLKKKGLISQTIKNKKYNYQAAKPETLISLLKDKETKIRRIIPKLKDLEKQTNNKQSTETYEGKQGIKTISEDMLTSKEILVYGASNIADQALGHYTENFARRRAESKIMLRAIIEKQVPKHMKNKVIQKYTKIKTSNTFKDHKCTYFIYADNVILVTLGDELTATKITNKDLANSQRKIFESMWKQ